MSDIRFKNSVTIKILVNDEWVEVVHPRLGFDTLYDQAFAKIGNETGILEDVEAMREQIEHMKAFKRYHYQLAVDMHALQDESEDRLKKLVRRHLRQFWKAKIKNLFTR